MKLEKIAQVTEKVEENVLTISEKEFQDIASTVMSDMLKKDKAVLKDPMMFMALVVSYGALLGKLQKTLFRQEETKE